MTKPFNPKHYTGQNRIFKAVSGARDIQRIWCWDAVKKEYRVPPSGHVFVARRYMATDSGGRKRMKKSFFTLEEARQWQYKLEEDAIVPLVEKNFGPTFQEVYGAFWRNHVSKLSSGTQTNIKRYTRLYFSAVMPIPMRQITPRFIDELLNTWRKTIGQTHQSRKRTRFKHELSLLRSVLSYYREYYEDQEFYYPLKARHAQDAIIGKAPPRHMDLQEEEFFKFRSELSKGKWGEILVPMATVQFYQALRISEVAALRFEDLHLNFKSPQDSALQIYQHVVYPREGGIKPKITQGYKNAKGGEIKKLHLFKGSFEALRSRFVVGGKGLVFGLNALEPFPYRVIQAAYDEAFKRADLPYRGTHVLRHGGTRLVYNDTNGDLTIAQQLLGNSDLKSTLIYAQRDKQALKKYVHQKWQTV